MALLFLLSIFLCPFFPIPATGSSLTPSLTSSLTPFIHSSLLPPSLPLRVDHNNSHTLSGGIATHSYLPPVPERKTRERIFESRGKFAHPCSLILPQSHIKGSPWEHSSQAHKQNRVHRTTEVRLKSRKRSLTPSHNCCIRRFYNFGLA